MQKTLAVLAAIVIFVALCLALAPILIDLDRHKDTIRALVEPAIGRRVDFDHLELTLMTGPGLRLEDVRIADDPAFSDEDFLTLEALTLRVRLLPLLSRHIAIRSLDVRRPVIRLLKNTRGEFNLESLVRTGDQAPSAPAGESFPRPPAGPAGPAPEGTPPILAALSVGRLSIREGRIVLHDETAPLGVTPIEIRALNISLRDIAPDTPLTFRIEGRLDHGYEIPGKPGSPPGAASDEDGKTSARPASFTLSGRLGPLAMDEPTLTLPRCELEAEITDLGLAAVSPWLPASLPQGLHSARLSLEMACVYDPAGESLHLTSASLSVDDHTLQASGTLTQVLTSPRWDLELRASSPGLEQLSAYAPKSLPPGLALQGRLALSAHTAGDAERFDFTSRLDLQEADLTYKSLFVKPAGEACALTLSGQQHARGWHLESACFTLRDLVLKASGDLELSRQPPAFEVHLQTSEIALDDWGETLPLMRAYGVQGTLAQMKASVKGTPSQYMLSMQASSPHLAGHTPPSQDASETRFEADGLVFDLTAHTREENLSSEGCLLIEGGFLDKAAFRDLEARFSSTTGKLTLSTLSLVAFGGRLHTQGTYHMESGEWVGTSELSRVDAGALTDNLTRFNGIFSGTLEASLRTMIHGDASPQRLEATGRFTLTDGQWRNFDLVDTLTDNLLEIEDLAAGLGIGPEIIKRRALTSFDSLAGTFALAQGILQLGDLSLSNISSGQETGAVAHLRGKLDLEGEQLDLEGAVQLSQRHTQKLLQRHAPLEALVNAQGLIELPLTISGSPNRPRVNIDTAAVRKALARYYARRSVDQGLERLQKRYGIPPEGTRTLDQFLQKVLPPGRPASEKPSVP